MIVRFAGAAIIVVTWQVLGGFGLLGPAIAPPTEIVAGVFADGASFYAPHVPATLGSALLGYLWGNLAAVGCASLVIVLPWLEKLVLQIGIASACIPLVAVAPILAAVFNGPTACVVMAGVSVFFTTLVSTVNGLRLSDRTSEDLIRAYGGGRLAVLRKVQLLSALPSLLTALKIAVPAAVLGTIIGEFMGQERGLGAALMVAQQSADVVRTWGITLVSSLLTVAAFLAVAAVERLATPWTGAAR